MFLLLLLSCYQNIYFLNRNNFGKISKKIKSNVMKINISVKTHTKKIKPRNKINNDVNDELLSQNRMFVVSRHFVII